MITEYDIDPERALPAAAYRPDSFAADMERIFRDDWVFVGTADEVAEPGDYVAVDLGGQPVIVLRNQAGELAALSNMCAHRGTLLVDGRGSTKRFQCPYHAWTFRDDGGLLSVPHAERDAVDRAAHCLPAYRAGEWHGLVFATMNPGAAPLADRFAHLESLAAETAMAGLHHWTSARGHEMWDANWKLVIANAMESYHLFKVHPETLEPYSPTADAYYLLGNADGTATGGRNTDGTEYTLFSLPPNFVGAVTNGSLLWQTVQPVAADRTRVITGGAYRSPPPDASSGLSKWMAKAMSKASEMAVPDFLPEDKFICERGQRAATGDFTPGPILAVEQVISDFHHYLNRQLRGVAVPAVRTSAEVGIARPVADVTS
ncbi:MAG: aromatic ring-hydroxylating oxygenase subunit alpha [Ilumatobacteraceae bacterium]